MKTGVWISLILLALTIGLGVWSGEEVRALSEEYAASAEELRTLAEAENWAGAEASLQKCQSVWKQKVPWLQTLINHDDVDAVTTALKKNRSRDFVARTALVSGGVRRIGGTRRASVSPRRADIGQRVVSTAGASWLNTRTQHEEVTHSIARKGQGTTSLAEAKSFTFPTAR